MIGRKLFLTLIIMFFAKAGSGLEVVSQEKLRIPLSLLEVFTFSEKILNCDQMELNSSFYQEIESIYTFLGWNQNGNFMKNDITDACWARKELNNNPIYSSAYLELKEAIFQTKIRKVYASLTLKSDMSLNYVKPLQELCDEFETKIVCFSPIDSSKAVSKRKAKTFNQITLVPRERRDLNPQSKQNCLQYYIAEERQKKTLFPLQKISFAEEAASFLVIAPYTMQYLVLFYKYTAALEIPNYKTLKSPERAKKIRDFIKENHPDVQFQLGYVQWFVNNHVVFEVK